MGARALAVENNMTGAIAAFKKYYFEDRSNPAPLFACAAVLERKEKFKDAVNMYRYIMREFYSKRAVYGEAGLRLAHLLANAMGDDAQANKTLHDVMRHCRGWPQAKSAANRIAHKQQGH